MNYADEGGELVLITAMWVCLIPCIIVAAPATALLWCLGWIRVRIREARKR